MTIDLGFAFTKLPSGEEISFVDVPGHSRLVKNMISGVVSLDACLFVVDATEGWKEQSEEHLQILELLGLRYGIIALTKAQRAGRDLLNESREDVADRVKGTFLANAKVVPVDSPTGRGIKALRAGLDEILVCTPISPDAGRPRLWVDRSFSIHRRGQL